MTRSSESAGKEVLAYCTSCKMDLIHWVVAMKGDKIAKAQCKTCNKEHVYKAPKGITEPGEQVKKKSTKKEKTKTGEGLTADGTPIAQEWEKLMNTHKNNPMKSYNTKGLFLLGDKLNHPSFGEGIVGKIIYPNKIEVIFRNNVKILIHGGSTSASNL
jgi:ribosomal protein L44E